MWKTPSETRATIGFFVFSKFPYGYTTKPRSSIRTHENHQKTQFNNSME